MEHNFTVEEVNFICIFADESKTFTLESRTEVIEEISRAMKYLEDNVLLELSEKVIGRLKGMSDKEFAGFRFVAAD